MRGCSQYSGVPLLSEEMVKGWGNALSILVVALVNTRMSMGRGDALSGVPSKLGIVKG